MSAMDCVIARLKRKILRKEKNLTLEQPQKPAKIHTFSSVSSLRVFLVELNALAQRWPSSHFWYLVINKSCYLNLYDSQIRSHITQGGDDVRDPKY